MDKNVEWFIRTRVIKTIDSLRKNNINGYFVESSHELIGLLDTLVPDKSKVACGGSMTLFETGVIDYLRHRDVNFLDRYQEGLTPEQIKEIYRGAFSTDVYFSSSNAVTEDGLLYNVDGNGNRVAAMIYGPDKVVIICGINKIVKNLDEAIERNRNIAAPINAKRLDRKTPCTKTGECMDCKSPEKICREFTVIKSQNNSDRIHVIFVNEILGY
ncbi:MAG: lactate utilization protein [Sarcina sp.]